MSTPYDAAFQEYRQQVRWRALIFLPVLLVAVAAQFVWPGAIGTIVLALIAGGGALAYQTWQRRTWRSLIIKYGLTNG